MHYIGRREEKEEKVEEVSPSPALPQFGAILPLCPPFPSPPSSSLCPPSVPSDSSRHSTACVGGGGQTWETEKEGSVRRRRRRRRRRKEEEEGGERHLQCCCCKGEGSIQAPPQRPLSLSLYPQLLLLCCLLGLLQRCRGNETIHFHCKRNRKLRLEGPPLLLLSKGAFHITTPLPSSSLLFPPLPSSSLLLPPPPSSSLLFPPLLWNSLERSSNSKHHGSLQEVYEKGH